MKKKYAVVRVDDKCPNKIEHLKGVCITSDIKFNCPSCRYGDTKEMELAKQIIEFLGVGI